jgi:hypothetical protein
VRTGPGRGDHRRVTTTALNQLRIYLVDGPDAGRSLRASRSPARIVWAGEEYRRVINLRGTHFYRRGR